MIFILAIYRLRFQLGQVKFIFLLQCEGIVEDMDEHFLELLADEANSPTLAQRICVEEGEYCKSVKEEL